MSRRRERPRCETLTGRKYPAELCEPIQIGLADPRLNRGILSTFTELDNDEGGQFANYNDEIFRRRSAKLKSLFEFYNIEPETGPGAWIQLSWALASAHVPGFQIAKKHGRPRGAISDFEVCNRVFEYLQKNPGKKITEASRALTRRDAPLGLYSAERIRRIYAAHKAWRQIFEDAASFRDEKN